MYYVKIPHLITPYLRIDNMEDLSMKKSNAIYFTDIENVKPILNDDLKPTKYYVDYNSYVYEKQSENKYVPCKMRFDKDNRSYCNIDIENGLGKRAYPSYRLAAIAFQNNPQPYSYYSDLEADHINPTKPLRNSVDNIELVSQRENMRRAGETGVMIKKYQKDLVHKICQMICDGIPRYKIKQELNINGQLIDDIHAGRSHRSVSCQYISKGFVYKKYDKMSKENLVRYICELFVKGYKPIDVVHILNDELKDEAPNSGFVYFIHNRHTFKNISKDYIF